jgi:hypothetical protein
LGCHSSDGLGLLEDLEECGVGAVTIPVVDEFRGGIESLDLAHEQIDRSHV